MLQKATPDQDLHSLQTVYGKCSKILNFILYFFTQILLFMQLFLKILRGMAKSADPDQTSPSDQIWVCTVCICYFVRKVGVQNFRTAIIAIFL